MPIIEHRRFSTVDDQCNWLASHRNTVTSQIGQDGIIAKIFDIINLKHKLCVEFGAWDGKYLSNTWTLIADQGWSGVLLEADPTRCDEIRANHPYARVQVANQLVTWEGETSFDATMRRLEVPTDIDLVSIDIDGNDWHVWSSIKLYRPRVIVIEFNPTVPNDIYFVQDANLNVNQGSSLLAMIELGKAKGYSLVCVNEWDAFFVLEEYYNIFHIKDNSIDSMFSSAYETKIFQGFDGTIYTAGLKELLWKGVKFESDTLQILEPSARYL